MFTLLMTSGALERKCWSRSFDWHVARGKPTPKWQSLATVQGESSGFPEFRVLFPKIECLHPGSALEELSSMAKSVPPKSLPHTGIAEENTCGDRLDAKSFWNHWHHWSHWSRSAIAQRFFFGI